MTAALPLDHLVINTRFETDAAESVFTRLGFTLTPRGRHAMGSVNHLMVFGSDFLELIGLPTDGGPLRQEILDQPIGIDGLVYRPDSADAVHARLTALGLPLVPLHAFTRPLEIDGVAQVASFRTVRFAPGTFAGGRVYYCQHLTPELVWRPQWQSHPNTACGLVELTVVTPEPEADARRHATVAFGDAVADGLGGWQVGAVVPGTAPFTTCFVDLDRYRAAYGATAAQPLGRSRFYGAIGVAVGDPAVAGARVQALGSRVVAGLAQGPAADQALAVLVPDFNTTLSFRTLQGR